MTSWSRTATSKTLCIVDISLSDDSKVRAEVKDIRKVVWQTRDEARAISLSDTVVLRKLAMSMLSVPALLNTGIALFLLPGKALFIDLEHGIKSSGIAA